MGTSSAATMTPSSSITDTLASCALIPHRMHATLANNSGRILLVSQWQCLARSYSEVHKEVDQLLQLVLGKHDLATSPLLAPLHALEEAMLEGERCLLESIYSPSPPSNHSWLLNKALTLGASTDIVDVHLCGFLWAFAIVVESVVNILSQIDNFESKLIQVTRLLSSIWESDNGKDDFSLACNLLTTIKCNEEGETSSLADFVLQKVSHVQEFGSVAMDALPSFFWVDSESLQRNPEILGLGGYGKVHEAEWLGGRFAVKDFFYVENNEVFGREAVIQARLRHPNVIPLVCCTKKPSLHKCSLVMELMQRDLRVWMLERAETGIRPPFSLGVAVDLMLQIAQGMEYLHSLHIMHRDLKSSNILVNYPKEICSSDKGVGKGVTCVLAHLKVADFGMSKAKHASSKYTSKQVGATQWRAPEVFDIEPEDEVEDSMKSKYTNKADVYSFALVCYEILTGKSPFEGTQVRNRVLSGERPKLPSHCPQALSSYIESCWDVEPEKRPPFSQICRVLRYIKAAVFFHDQSNGSPTCNSWLSKPLSYAVYAHIDDMVLSFMQPNDTLFQPQPLNIPLEMHCCRVVLQQTPECEGTSHHEHADREIDNQTNFNLSASPKKICGSSKELQQRQCKFRWKFKVHVFKWLKKLLCIPGNHLAKSELQEALGLVREFTFNELQIATNYFYRIVGEGGSGKVYHGKLEDGREIAVKVTIRPKALQSGRLLSQSETMGFVQELRVASQLRHRNIVPLFGWCLARGKFYLVYEFMLNGNLAGHIFGKPSSPVLNWQQRYEVSCQLASALKYLHKDSGYLQIVHRDIKATNVLLDSEWNARLGDCGLALLLRGGDSPACALAGTPGYIAPECTVHGRVSPASDVYSFGVTILEIVSGRRASSGTYFLRDWALQLFQHGDLMKVADVRLKGDFEKTELNRLLLLGLSCTSADPHFRPDTEELLEILSGASEPSPLRDQTMQSSRPVTRTAYETHRNPPDNVTESGLSISPSQQNESLRVFQYKELKLATKNFGPDNHMGEGGFGPVYKGLIDANRTRVAIKVLNSDGLQSHKESLAQIFFLGRLKHPHLVKLIGYCAEDDRRILVFELLARGSLDRYLFAKEAECLAWNTRMEIALGVAKGLAFLHTQSVIMRDVKASKILLDSDYTAKLSDFGLAKSGPEGDRTHVTTRVMGTYGYVAPEYLSTGHLTEKSDVYGFGMVLLEILTGRQSIDLSRPAQEQSLREWAHPYLRGKRHCQRMIDAKLNGMYPLDEAYKAASLSFKCLALDHKSRPWMSDVVQRLEALRKTKE